MVLTVSRDSTNLKSVHKTRTPITIKIKHFTIRASQASYCFFRVVAIIKGSEVAVAAFLLSSSPLYLFLFVNILLFVCLHLIIFVQFVIILCLHSFVFICLFIFVCLHFVCLHFFVLFCLFVCLFVCILFVWIYLFEFL